MTRPAGALWPTHHLLRPLRAMAEGRHVGLTDGRLRRWLKERHIKAVIPSSANRTVPYPLDRTAYRRRDLIERPFCRLKNWRRIATRHDRLARNYLAGLALVAVTTEWTK